MKAVLISIQPKWCELIASGKKTIEIRKTKPKIDGPFKCYIYCTKNKQFFNCGGMRLSNEDLYRLPNGEIKCGCSVELMSYGEDEYDENNFLNGKVICEFVCDRIIDIPYSECFVDYCHAITQDELKATCLDMRLIDEYLLSKNGYGWHISELKIYDKPKELYEFYRKCEKLKCETCEHLKYQRVNSSEYDYDCEYVNGHIPITRAPQSWCYVEEVRNVD